MTLSGESGIEVDARLVRERGNPYDPSAVRVELLRTGLCGHLAREDAGKYKPVLDDLARQGYHGQCKGLVFGGGDRHYGVWLELAHAPEAVPKNQPPKGPRVWRPSYRLNRPVNIRCAMCRPEVLAAYEPRPPDGVTALFCTLATCVIQREKDQQQRAIEVHVDGRRAGELTWGRMTQRYADMLDRVDGGWVFCAELIWIGDALVAEVLLPSVPETLGRAARRVNRCGFAPLGAATTGPKPSYVAA